MTRSLTPAGRALRDSLEEVMALLLEKTGASRTTLRIDLPEIDASVTLPIAEALHPGERSLRQEGGVNQREAATVQWLERHRKTLVQNDFKEEPKPPQALVDIYGTKAQMLGPIVLGGALVGWISVHENTGPRIWREGDIAALQDSLGSVTRLIEDFTAANTNDSAED